MSNNTIRIRTTPDGKDKFVKVKLDQEFDFIEILSLKITQEEVYRNFCADYGVVVGRVFVNNGFGVPNARVSIFIPVDDIDKNDPIINGLYPYEVITDKDIDGKRYNLLPKNSETDNDCYTPVGTFPNKREVLDDPEMGYIYSKYYKFTTTTNYAGDYMIFGVPIGNYTVHVDADISDIGIASQRPYDSISQGVPIQMFDSPTKFKGGTNLDRLIQIKSTNAGVNIQPFWGSVDNCEIGISRIDLDLNYEIKPSAIFMGGLFGDTDNNSVNKNCRPRRRMGKICEQNTSEGTIEMIRKTLDGNIEKLDIEGGRLIDENGSWSYQIPMNLDYYYTNEFGDLVLSEDPNKGIPTRASVRFKIAMDDTGGEGRLRTKANYLVPHNPKNKDEIDYEFGELTKDFSFRDLYWNKIYSVSNFISRYQRANSLNPVNDRNFVGLKDVDDCIGVKNPAPFNRVNTLFNPLFSIICLIMTIIEFVIFIINSVVITALNLVMQPINALIRVVCAIIGVIRRILRIVGLRRLARRLNFGFCNTTYFIPCIGAYCPSKNEPDGKLYAPGCVKDGFLGKGYEELEKKEGLGSIFSTKFGSLSDCVSFQLAKLLNLFQFDFYNDWLNGSLYYFLVKYKKRRRKEKYCNHDCNGNDCNSSILIDTCYNSENTNKSIGLREGLIKKYKNELFYAPTIKNGVFKLYATELINLGSVFKCDWQGVPKIHEFLIPTTYSSPPNTDILVDDSTETETSGQVEIGNDTKGLFFKISCAGLSSNQRQTLNLRHVCEFGVDLDERDVEDNGTIVEANHIIGSKELDSEFGKYFRDVFFGLNNITNNVNIQLPYSTEFNLCNSGVYDFSSDSISTTIQPPCSLPQNGSDYVDFRGYLNNSSFSQPKHSYYFYFGLVAGATGLDKMNNKFFTKCQKQLESEFLIRIDDTTAISQNGATDGVVTFTIISGLGPFEYIVSGPNGYNTSGTLTESNINQTINGLAEGAYIISVTDSSNVVITQSFDISGAIPLYATAFVSNINTSLSDTYNGEITLSSIGGGSGTYTATLYNSNGVIVPVGACSGGQTSAQNPQIPVTQLPIIFCGLPPDNGTNIGDPNFSGYYIVVKDDSSPEQEFTINNLILNGVVGLNSNVSLVQPTCYDSTNGRLTINVTGGIQPYEITTVQVGNQSEVSFTGNLVENLPIGQYNVTINDSSPEQQTLSLGPYILSPIYPEMKLIAPDPVSLASQCDSSQYKIKLKIQNGGVNSQGLNYTDQYGSAYYQVNFDDNSDSNDELIWSTPVNVGYNSNNEFEVLIPSSQSFDSVAIRLCNPQGTCGSNIDVDETIFSVSEMRLPPAPLIIDVLNIDNNKQCTPNKFSFKFNISHLSLLANYRAPYTLEYQFMNNLGAWPTTYTTHGTLLNQNQQLVTLNVPPTNILLGNNVRVRFRIIDNVGCRSNVEDLGLIKIPTFELNSNNVSWQSTLVSSGVCEKRYTINNNAGIAPYTIITGPNLDSPTSNTGASQFPCNFITSVTIQDSVGCIVTKNSN
jgi:hypothetical protein